MAGAFTLLALYDFVCEVAPRLRHAPRPVPDGLSLFAARASGLNGVAAGAVFAANVQVSERKADSLSNLGMMSTNPQRTVELRAHPAYWQGLELQA